MGKNKCPGEHGCKECRVCGEVFHNFLGDAMACRDCGTCFEFVFGLGWVPCRADLVWEPTVKRARGGPCRP